MWRRCMEDEDVFIEAVKALPRMQKAVFLLAGAHDLTNLEIAQALSIGVDEVERALARALRGIASKLDDFQTQ